VTPRARGSHCSWSVLPLPGTLIVQFRGVLDRLAGVNAVLKAAGSQNAPVRKQSNASSSANMLKRTTERPASRVIHLGSVSLAIRVCVPRKKPLPTGALLLKAQICHDSCWDRTSCYSSLDRRFLYLGTPGIRRVQYQPLPAMSTLPSGRRNVTLANRALFSEPALVQVPVIGS
jgi:hypothetical protein